ncbi:TetR/AcrR family transcriptional regulator [Kribbella sp. WER1]
MSERRRPGRPRSRAVTRELIVRTAVRMLDADGYQAFSLRQLADALGVTVSTVIHHVGQRTEVLVAVVDHLLREALLDPRTGADAADDWRDGVRLVATSYREVLLRHPRAATLILDVARRSPAGIEASMRLLMLLRRGGVPVQQLLATHTAIVGYVTGFSLQQGGEGLIGNEHRSMAAYLEEIGDPELADEYAELLAELTASETPATTQDEGFALGLEALITGLTQTIGAAHE